MRTLKEIEYLIFILIFLNIIAKSTFIFFLSFYLGECLPFFRNI